ncbi:hypothetical protein [Cysteiniphilum halobium]|uniref:hypothetical protein n=1 Tax=Cysteiniphilum TaxID=2056696 RepID=UPI000E64CD84|nr:hypothetical protein [Cysteiniphilum halobium]
MTIEEFNKQGWTAGMTCIHTCTKTGNKHTYSIATVTFSEALVGLCDPNVDECKPEDIHWVRCENIELVKEN